MTQPDRAPAFVRAASVLTVALARAGVTVTGFGKYPKYPMYLLTVRGRNRGQPRTVPIGILERNGRRYLASPYGIVHWVRNLRAAGEEILTRGRHTEWVVARELPQSEAALVLCDDIRKGNPFARCFGVTAGFSLEALARAVVSHPLLVLQRT